MESAFLDFPRDAIRLTFLETGQHQWKEVKSDWIHEKTVPYAIIAQAYVGSYGLSYGDQSAMARAPEAFLAPPLETLRILHQVDRKRHAVSARWVHFRFMLFETIDLFTLLRMPLKLDVDHGRQVGRIFQELRTPAGVDNGLYKSVRRMELAWGILRIVCEVSEPRVEAWELVKASDRLRPVLRYLRANLGESISVGEMASQAHMCESAFHPYFRRHLGRTPMDYLKFLRLNEAAQRLNTPDVPVRQVADAVGFRNPFHFSREFKRQFGLSPQAYRQMRQLGYGGSGLA